MDLARMSLPTKTDPPAVLCWRPAALLLGVLTSASTVEPAPIDAINARTVSAAAEWHSLQAALDDARFLRSAGHPAEALDILRQARTGAADGTPSATMAAADRLIIDLGRDLQQSQTAQADTLRQVTAQIGLVNSQREITTETDLRRARLLRIADLRRRGHLELALAQARALWRQDPQSAEADRIFRQLLDEVHTQRRIELDLRSAELRQEVSNRIERSLIPEGHDGRPVFPSDWKNRHRDRSNAFSRPDAVPAWQEALLDRLATRVDLRFDGTPVPEALQVVARLAGINMVIEPSVLAATDHVVSLRCNRMLLENTLSWICDIQGTRWQLLDGAVYIGDQRHEQPVMSTYDVSAMLLPIPDFPGKILALGQDAQGAGFNAAAVEGADSKIMPEQVVDLIKATVSPSTWTEPSHGITIQGTTLLVTAPARIQGLVREFLRAQDQLASLSVRITCRWLTLRDQFAEEIGTQWKSLDGLANNVPPVQVTTTGAGVVRNIGSFRWDAGTTNQLPPSAMSQNPALAGTGLTLQGAVLGNNQLSAILSAVERSADGRVLASPEIACMHGQLANCFFGDQAAYIADYEIASNNYDPVIRVLNLGTSLEVRPLISADRRYVTLNIQGAQATATFYTEVIDGWFISPGSNTTSSTLTGSQVTFPLELPNVAVKEFGTTTMLPDRGSILIGGFNGSLDQFSATRIPLLGSIPFLGRLFGGRGRYHDRTKLHVLATVDIINYPELEARL